MPTKHHGWVTLAPGQIEVSRPFNAFVTDLDEKIYAVRRLLYHSFGSGVIHGLEVTLSGNSLVVGAGVAIVDDIPFALNEPYGFTPTIPEGYVVLRRHPTMPTVTIGTTALPLSTDVVLAQFSTTTQTVIDKRPLIYLPTSLTARTEPLFFVVGDGQSAITTGFKGVLWVPFAARITQWVVASCDTLPPSSGSITIDVLTCSYQNYPTMSSLVGSGTKPFLTNSIINKGAPSDWATTTLPAGTLVGFQVDAVATLSRVAVVLELLRE